MALLRCSDGWPPSPARQTVDDVSRNEEANVPDAIKDGPAIETSAPQVQGKAPEQIAAGSAGPSAGDIVQQAKTHGTAAYGEVKDKALSAAESGKDAVADRLDSVAEAVHRSGEQLEGQQDWIAHLVERGADELASLASTLRTNDLRGLMGKLEDLAQRQPAVFVGAAMAAGFAAVRIGKVAVAGASKSDLPDMPDLSAKGSSAASSGETQ